MLRRASGRERNLSSENYTLLTTGNFQAVKPTLQITQIMQQAQAGSLQVNHSQIVHSGCGNLIRHFRRAAIETCKEKQCLSGITTLAADHNRVYVLGDMDLRHQWD